MSGERDRAAPVAESPARREAGLSLVRETLSRTGRPLDAATRTTMESRLGHDFSRVRVHSDTLAARSARAVDARAYTVGDSIAFGAGEYRPESSAGRRLLAHELTHVAQQSGAGSSPALARSDLRIGPVDDRFEREARAAADRVGGDSPAPASAAPARTVQRGLLDWFDDWGGTDFSEVELQKYLEILRSGQTAGGISGDNKARAVVAAWRLGGGPYVLTAQVKALLIREMQDGATLDADEQSILEILERSYNYELAYIFGSGGITADGLDGDFQGPEQIRLDDFFSRRFEGGKEDLKAGTVKPRGRAVPLGENLTQTSILDETLEGAVDRWNVPCVLGILCTQDADILQQVAAPGVEVQRIERIDVDFWKFEGGSWSSEVKHPVGLAKHGEGDIGLVVGRTCDAVAQTLYHEARHATQPDGLTLYQMEIDAYTFSEEWAIARGLPGRPRLRNAARTEPDPQAITEYVGRTYGRGGLALAADEQIVGHTQQNETVIRRGDGTEYQRPSEPGDSYLADPPILIGATTIPDSQWSCP